MEIKRMKAYIIIFLSASILVGCSTANEKPSINYLLTKRSQKRWVNYSQTLNGVEQLQNCAKDDVFTFYVNGDVISDPGVLRCSLYEYNIKYGFLLAGPDNDSFYFKFYLYSIDTDKEYIQTYRGRILQLDEKNFVFRTIYVSEDGSTFYNNDFYFKAADE